MEQLTGDDVRCSGCQNIFDCRNHQGVWCTDGWICEDCTEQLDEEEDLNCG